MVIPSEERRPSPSAWILWARSTSIDEDRDLWEEVGAATGRAHCEILRARAELVSGVTHECWPDGVDPRK